MPEDSRNECYGIIISSLKNPVVKINSDKNFHGDSKCCLHSISMKSKSPSAELCPLPTYCLKKLPKLLPMLSTLPLVKKKETLVAFFAKEKAF